MRIEFNHTILATQDAHGSALFQAEMLGMQPPRRWGPFWMVKHRQSATWAHTPWGPLHTP